MNKVLLVITLLMFSCNPKSEDISQIDRYLQQYKPYKMQFDASAYSETDKQILKNLVRASAYIDTIYWHQTSKYALHLRDSLQKLPDENSKKLMTLLRRNAAPYEQLNEHATFVGNLDYYPGDEIYPRGMTVEQFDAFYETLSEEQKKEFMNPYTVIREDGNGGYKAVRYYEEYKEYVDPIIRLLNESAALTDNPSFAKFLRLKAEALTTDEYFDADVSWIDMENNSIDIVFGPFETYSDGIKGVKAKYESSIEIVDQQESKNLEIYTQYLKDLETNLPVPEEYKSVVNGLTAKFVVVRDIIRAGEAAAGYQAVATNLPNDPEVHSRKGTKKTFWKNMFEARFNAIITPVSERLIHADQLQYLSDEGFFTFVLMHEICHAIGPRTVKVGEKKGMAVNAAIGPNYNSLEECKADVVGLHSLAYLIDAGVIDKEKEEYFYVSYLGSLFRSVRFGLNEAHAKGAAISINYLLKNGGLLYDSESNKWTVDFTQIRQGIASLSKELLILEGNGENEQVVQFFDTWAVFTPPIQNSLKVVADLPIDVLPEYSINWD